MEEGEMMRGKRKTKIRKEDEDKIGNRKERKAK